MKKKKLLKKIEELEKRVSILESKGWEQPPSLPWRLPQPLPTPIYPYAPCDPIYPLTTWEDHTGRLNTVQTTVWMSQEV